MVILDTATLIEDGKIKIKEFHRGHLSLKTGTEVTLVLLPGRECNPIPTLSELIISPIPFEAWEFLTRINAKVVNHPGVLRKLMRALSEQNIHIMYHASGPIENGRHQRVEFIVDATSYYSKFEGMASEGKMKDCLVLTQLEVWLKGLIIDHLAFDDKRARLKVRPMEAFKRTWKAYRKFIMRKDYPDPEKAITTVEEGGFRIPTKILNSIHSEVKSIMFNSDTKDRMLRGLIFHPLVTCSYLRVVHNEIQML